MIFVSFARVSCVSCLCLFGGEGPLLQACGMTGRVGAVQLPLFAVELVVVFVCNVAFV